MGPIFDVKRVEKALDALLAYTHPVIDLSPTIRIAPSARPSHAYALRAMLQDLEETRSDFAALERKIEKLVLGVEQRRAACITALAPVSGLPKELLVAIFNIVAKEDRTSRARITLSHVSSVWRNVALGAKELWTVIQVPSHSPEMVHEFAGRSGSLCLELSTRSLAGWPEDLALTSDEASRLSVVLSHRSPSLCLRASLKDHASLIDLESLTIASGGITHNICDGLTRVRTVKLDGMMAPYSATRVQMNHLRSLIISNSSAGTASEHLKLIRAPLLSQLELSGITAKDIVATRNDSNDEDEEEPHPTLDLGGHQDQITVLTLTRNDRIIYNHAFRFWKLSNLVYLTLRLADLSAFSLGVDIRQLHNLFSDSPAMKNLYIASSIPIPPHLFGESSAPFLIPKLETLSLVCTNNTNSRKDVNMGRIASSREGLIDALRMRSQQPGIQRLRHFIISSSFMDNEVKEQEQYGEYIDEVAVDDS